MPAKRIVINEDNMITTTTSDVVDISGAVKVSANLIVTVDTPSAAASAAAAVNTTTDVITATAHDFTTGLKGQFTTDDTLPTGISAATDYFIIVTDDNNYQVATTLANALAGTNVDITGQGAGNHTFTPTSIAGATVKIQYSNDPSNSNSWVDGPAANSLTAAALGGSAHSITASSAVFFRDAPSCPDFARLVYTITAGRMSTQTIWRMSP